MVKDIIKDVIYAVTEKKDDRARKTEVLQRQEQLEFKSKMNMVKRSFKKSIGTLEKMRLERAKKARLLKDQKNISMANSYAKEVEYIGKCLLKLNRLSGKIDMYVSRVEIMGVIAGSVSGLQTISDEITKVTGKIDFSSTYVDMGTAIAGFELAEEQLDALFEQLDDIFEPDVDDELASDEELDGAWDAVDLLLNPENSLAISESEKDAQRFEQINRLLSEDD